MEVLFGLGIGIILAAVVSVLSPPLSKGEPGDGGLGICVVFCALAFAPFHVAAGILCMVGLEKWNLIASIVFNLISIFLHSYMTYHCYDCKDKEKFVEELPPYMMRLGGQLGGMMISIAAIVVAIQCLIDF